MSKNFEVGLRDEVLKAEHKWYGKEDQTEDKSIHDIGKGEPVVIRTLEYSLKPGLEKSPTKEELLTPSFLKHLNAQLWGDGFRLVLEPRVHVGKDKFYIFATCVATTGNIFLEEPKYLQEWIS